MLHNLTSEAEVEQVMRMVALYGAWKCHREFLWGLRLAFALFPNDVSLETPMTVGYVNLRVDSYPSQLYLARLSK